MPAGAITNWMNSDANEHRQHSVLLTLRLSSSSASSSFRVRVEGLLLLLLPLDVLAAPSSSSSIEYCRDRSPHPGFVVALSLPMTLGNSGSGRSDESTCCAGAFPATFNRAARLSGLDHNTKTSEY